MGNLKNKIMVQVNAENYQKQAEITNEVYRLLKNVKQNTGHFSTLVHVTKHEDFKKLVAMGDSIVNYLFHVILEQGADWMIFELIRQLTNVQPVPKDKYGYLIWHMIYWLKWYAQSDYYKNNDIYYGLVK